MKAKSEERRAKRDGRRAKSEERRALSALRSPLSALRPLSATGLRDYRTLFQIFSFLAFQVFGGTPREFFNAGAQNLGAGKLAEAETFLERALASQDERLQPAALYNLGHVRFGQGIEELKKGPSAPKAFGAARTAARQGEEAIGSAEQALADNDVGKMVQSYLRGRGARTELKAATAAVRRALDTHGAALAKWQRASGDFKSAVELNDTDADSRFNAEVVDRNVAKLVDSVHELQQCAGALGDKSRELSEKLKQLKGRIPAAQMPPGAAGDDEDDEDSPFGLQPGQKEGPSKEGQEIPLSPEQAGWLLEAFKLDRERHLPMGQGAPAQPRDRSRPDW